MPTGYTAIIEEKPDLTFREFALRCARGMGACIMQRDDPMDDPPRAPEPSDYHAKALQTATSRLAELRGMKPEAIRAMWQAEVERIDKSNAESRAKAAETERRYKRMREQVAAWSPPSKDHQGLKRFMLEQIDACESDWKAYVVEAPPTPKDWHAAELKRAERDVAYHTKEHGEELQRALERKEWIEKLYAALPEGK
jgi:hypothetical protein